MPFRKKWPKHGRWSMEYSSRHFLLRSAGGSLLSVLILLTLLSIMASFFLTKLRFISNRSKNTQLISDLEDVQEYVLSTADCPPAVCVVGKYVQITQSLGPALIRLPDLAAGYSQVGESNYFLRATCVDCSTDSTCTDHETCAPDGSCAPAPKTKRIAVEFRYGTRPTSGIEPLPFPQSLYPDGSWLDWKDLFGVGNSYWCLVD